LGNQEQQDQDTLLAFYSHTSRASNSAIALTLAGMALFISILPFFTPLPILFRIFLASILYGAVVYGFIRIIEMNVQMQFLESMIRINEITLLQFINQTVPRFWRRTHRRFNQEQIQALQRDNWPLRRCFNPAHWIAIAIWTLIFMIAIYILLSTR